MYLHRDNIDPLHQVSRRKIPGIKCHHFVLGARTRCELRIVNISRDQVRAIQFFSVKINDGTVVTNDVGYQLSVICRTRHRKLLAEIGRQMAWGRCGAYRGISR